MGNAFSFIGRLLLGALFITAGVRKIMGFAGTVQYISSAGLPNAEILAYATIALEIVAGLMLIIGFQAKLAALALAAFSVAAAVLFHKFWAVAPEQYANQLNHFLKNVAVAGGLLLVLSSPVHNPMARGGAAS